MSVIKFNENYFENQCNWILLLLISYIINIFSVLNIYCWILYNILTFLYISLIFYNEIHLKVFIYFTLNNFKINKLNFNIFALNTSILLVSNNIYVKINFYYFNILILSISSTSLSYCTFFLNLIYQTDYYNWLL